MAILKTKQVIKPKTQKIVLKDRFVSTLSEKEIAKFRSQQQSVEETLRTPKSLDQPLQVTIDQGIELAKQHNRKIATEAVRGL